MKGNYLIKNSKRETFHRPVGRFFSNQVEYEVSEKVIITTISQKSDTKYSTIEVSYGKVPFLSIQ